MKLLLLNAYDIQGGAAIATHRLHQGLRSSGVDSTMLVQVKSSDDATVVGPVTRSEKLVAFIRPYLDQAAIRRYPARSKALFTPAWLPEHLARRVTEFEPDIVHLFWMSGGFFRIESLKRFGRPVVWTLHDMWPFTGGCHYDAECGKFRQSCGNCPLLNSGRERDLSSSVLERKHRAWDGVPIVVVATSQWIADMARASSLFKDKRIEVIPNGLDTAKYKPVDKVTARNALNLSQDKNLVLFSAFSATSDKRKGNQYLQKALEGMARDGWGEKAELVVVGASRPDNPPNLGMPVHYMGYLHDEISQVLLYSATDVLVAPSMQENLSNTVIESMACGTPVVAFNIGGMPDMIDHRSNGYLAKPFEPNDLAKGITWVIEDKDRHAGLSRQARQTVLERYTLELVVNRYQNLYRSLRA